MTFCYRSVTDELNKYSMKGVTVNLQKMGPESIKIDSSTPPPCFLAKAGTGATLGMTIPQIIPKRELFLRFGFYVYFGAYCILGFVSSMQISGWNHLGLSGLAGESSRLRQPSSVSLSLIGCLNS